MRGSGRDPSGFPETLPRPSRKAPNPGAKKLDRGPLDPNSR